MRQTAIAKLVMAASSVALLSAALPALANPVTDLPGQWSGWGSVVLNSGTTEKVKCVAVYKVANGGGQVQQNLKCASTSYNINAVADLTVLNGQVSGKWEEKSYSATGAVTGKASAHTYQLSIDGGAFSAAMNVATSGCKQSINIVPQGMDISKISIGLGKC